MVFIKNLAWCFSESDGDKSKIVMGMTRGLQGVDATAHPLKGLLSRPRTVLFSLLIHPSFRRSFSSQLFTAVGAGANLWLLGITSPALLSCLPSFLPLSPPLSPFLPPWSRSSCFIATMLPLHKQTTDTEVTSAAEGLFQTLPRSLSRPCRKLAVVRGYIIIRCPSRLATLFLP